MHIIRPKYIRVRSIRSFPLWGALSDGALSSGEHEQTESTQINYAH